MAELRQLNLTQLKQLIEGSDQHLANNYITRNLAVARNARISLIKEQIMNQPTLMPEMRILIIMNGWASPVINMMERRFEAGDLVFLSTNGILQYKDASSDVQGIGLSISDELFSLAIGNRIPRTFDGHLRLADKKELNAEKQAEVPFIKSGTVLTLHKVLPSEQHFTEPPLHYTEASLVKKMEEEGIGRPSTYSPIIQTIQTRGYVVRDGKKLMATDLGIKVADLLTGHFGDIINIP